MEIVTWDGTDRRKPQERLVREGILGPEYHHSRWDGIERRQTEHEKRLVKMDVKIEAMDAKLDEHTEILKSIGDSFTPLIKVLKGLTDWAIVFGHFMNLCRWCWGPVGKKLIVLSVLLWYYLKTGNLELIMKTIAG